MLTDSQACEPRPQVFKSFFHSSPMQGVFQLGVRVFVLEAHSSEGEMKINDQGLHLFIYLFIKKRVCFRERAPGQFGEWK